MYNRDGGRVGGGGGGRSMGGHSTGLLGRSPSKPRQDGQARQGGQMRQEGQARQGGRMRQDGQARQGGQMSGGMMRMLGGGGGGNRPALLGNPSSGNNSLFNDDQQYNQQFDQTYNQGDDYGSGYGVEENVGYGGQQTMFDRSLSQALNKDFNDSQGQGRHGNTGFNDGLGGQGRQGFNVNEGQTRQGLQGQGSRRDATMGRSLLAQQQGLDVYNDYNDQQYDGGDYMGDLLSDNWDNNYGGDQQGGGGGLLPMPSQHNQDFSSNLGGNSRNMGMGNTSSRRNIGREDDSFNQGRGNRQVPSRQALLAKEEPQDTYSLLKQVKQERGLLGQEPRNMPSLLGQPPQGRGRGLLGQQPMGAGLMNMNQNQHGMVNRQADLMQKAEMQMRMIEQEEREAVIIQQQKLLQEQEQVAERQRMKEMQALLETQQRALMLQQKENQMRMGGAGLLGDAPMQGGHMGGGMQQGRGQQAGGIPSLFDVQGPRKPSLLGKRPSVTVARANIAAKRARQESQNRAANKARRPSSPKRGGRDKSRGGQRKSRSEHSPSSKTRDRKESESRKSSNSQVGSGNSNKDGRSRKRESRGDDKVSMQVTVTTEEAYDPANPTRDSEEKKSKDDDDVQITGFEGPTKGVKKGTEKVKEEMDTSLTVTVSKKGRSVNDSDSKGDQDKKDQERELKYKCNVCDVKCFDEQSFSRHMNGMKHKKKMESLSTTSSKSAPLIAARKQAEEHLRQIELKRKGAQGKTSTSGKAMESHCKVCNEMFAGAYKDHKEVPKHRAKEDRRKAGCKVCKVTSFNSYGDFLKHLDSDWHKKKLKQESWPECKICNQTFKSPRKFVLHCKTDHHLKNKKNSNDDLGPDDLGDLVTLDTVGFEEETNQAPETKSSEKTEESESKMEVAPPTKTDQEEEELGEYDPSKAVGQKLVIAVWGFFCKLCHKFYNNESAAKGSHCQSQAHFDKYKKYIAARKLKQQLSDDGSSKQGKGEKSDVSTHNQAANGQSTDKTADQSKNGDSEMQQDVNTDYESANDSTVNQSDMQEDMETSDIESRPDNDNEITIEILSNTKDGSPRAGGQRSKRGGRRQTKKRV